MSRLLRINMGDRSVKWEDMPSEFALLGGRALTSRLIHDEVSPTAHPLGANNKLIFAPGFLTGTHAPSSGRLSVGGKSPLTGGIKESNAGGITGQQLANLGVAALIVEGQPEKGSWFILVLDDKGPRFEKADGLLGLGCYELNKRLWSKYGEGCGIIAIGPAGEALMPTAGISTNDRENDPGRYAGRGGLGAVMASKGLKAIVVKSKDVFGVPVADAEKFRDAAKRLAKALVDHPVSGQVLPTYGTGVLVNILNEAGALPTCNFKNGRFEGAAKIGGEAMAEVVKARGGKGKMGHGCSPGCVIRCSNIYPDKNGEALCTPIEYESAWALGANLGIDVLDDIAMLNRLCNDIGLDTVEIGVAFGVLMEAGLLPFGDSKKAIELLDKEVRHATPLGRIIGSGAAAAGRAYGVTRIPTVKGQSMPAYDPRAVKGLGVTYATSPMGADHTAGYATATNILKVGGYVDPLKAEGQVELSRNLQVATALVDGIGLCLFSAFALLDMPEAMTAACDLVAAKGGVTFGGDEAVAYGQRVLSLERAFNRAAGFGPADDRLPEFMYNELLPPHNVTFDVPDEQLDDVFKSFA